MVFAGVYCGCAGAAITPIVQPLEPLLWYPILHIHSKPTVLFNPIFCRLLFVRALWIRSARVDCIIVGLGLTLNYHNRLL